MAVMCDSMAGKEIRRRVRRYMLSEVSNVDNATQLAENAAHEFGHDEWLDDETHDVWVLALRVFNWEN